MRDMERCATLRKTGKRRKKRKGMAVTMMILITLEDCRSRFSMVILRTKTYGIVRKNECKGKQNETRKRRLC